MIRATDCVKKKVKKKVHKLKVSMYTDRRKDEEYMALIAEEGRKK